jgi:4-amino-4-deoxy-L-arabinose transferase-like glycosyltransferase
MAATGDYFWPTINGQTYYDKPLGSYWLVLAAASLHGGVDEMAARWPSAVSGLLAVIALMLIAHDLYGERESLLAGLILATSFGFTVFARTAAADSENVAGILVALWLCVRNEDRGGGWWILGLWTTMALTSLTKGLLGFAIPLMVFGIDRLWPSGNPRFLDRQRWLLNRVTPIAVALGLAIYAAPFLLSIRQTGSAEGLDMVWRENIRRFFDAHNHRGPIYLYVYVVFGLAAPWSVLLPAALVQAHAGRSRGDRFALSYFWSVFLFFTVSSSRRSYYLLPILPAVAFLVARLLTTPPERLTLWARRLMKFAEWFVIAAIVALMVAVLVPRAVWPSPWSDLPPLPAPLLLGVVLAAAIASFVFAARRSRGTRLALAIGVFAYGSFVYLFLVAIPETEQYRTQKPFLADVRERLGEDLPRLGLYRTRETIYYLAPPRPLIEIDSGDSLRADPPIGWLLARERDLPEVGFAGKIVMREPIQSWETADVRASKLVLLRLR